MPNTGRNHRNQRNNPYVLDDLAAQLHRTAAGVAWRWRTELAILALTVAALWRLTHLITLTWAGLVVRAACYAREARVTRNPRWSQLVTIDIIRRDKLAANHTVPSLLARARLIHLDRPGP